MLAQRQEVLLQAAGIPILALLLAITCEAATKATLSCYTCGNKQSNYMCLTQEPCEEGYDTCQTTVSYTSVSGMLSINKHCTKLAACQRQINATRDSEWPCDVRADKWICTNCCHTDGCNENGARARVSMATRWLRIFTFSAGLGAILLTRFRS